MSKLQRNGSEMQIGAAMFFTDYSMSAAELARALEERGFESVWAPEHSHIPLSRKIAVPGRRRIAETVLRRDGPVRQPVLGRRRDEDDQARDRRLSGGPARHDPDRQARRLARPGIERPLPVRHRRRLEPRRDGGSRHGLCDPLQENARADRGHAHDLDRKQARVSRRDRRFPADDDLAETGAEAISRRSLSAACFRMRRGARSATAMAGFRIRAARNTRT